MVGLPISLSSQEPERGVHHPVCVTRAKLQNHKPSKVGVFVELLPRVREDRTPVKQKPDRLWEPANLIQPIVNQSARSRRYAPRDGSAT